MSIVSVTAGRCKQRHRVTVFYTFIVFPISQQNFASLVSDTVMSDSLWSCINEACASFQSTMATKGRTPSRITSTTPYGGDPTICIGFQVTPPLCQRFVVWKTYDSSRCVSHVRICRSSNLQIRSTCIKRGTGMSFSTTPKRRSSPYI